MPNENQYPYKYAKHNLTRGLNILYKFNIINLGKITLGNFMLIPNNISEENIMKESICNFTKFTLFVALIMFCILWTCQQPKVAEETKPWVGKWMVVEGVDSSGVQFSDIGVYHYYNNGTFSSQLITSLDRPNLTSNPSTPGEYMAAFDVYRAGFGTYTINEKEDTLTYEYISNLRPHRIGQPTKVSFTVDNDIMTLIYNGGAITITLKRENID